MTAWQIPLSGQQPNVMTPGQAQQQQLSLQHLAGSNQMQQEQLKSALMANEEHERAFADQELLRRSYMEAEGDLPKLLEIGRKNGVSPKGLLGIQQAQLNQKKIIAQTDKAQRDVENILYGRLAGSLDGFLGEHAKSDPAAKAQAWPAYVQAQAAAGLLTPEQAKQFSSIPYPGDEQLRMIRAGLIGWQNEHKRQVDEALVSERNARTKKLEAEVGPEKTKAILDQVQVAAGKLRTAALQSPTAYNEMRGSLPADVAEFFERAPAAPQWKDNDVRDQFVSGVAFSAMRPAQQNAAEARANKQPPAKLLQSTEGAFLVWDNGPDQAPTVKEARTPGGGAIPKQPIGGTSAQRQAERDRRAELDKGTSEEQNLFKQIRVATKELDDNKSVKGDEFKGDSDRKMREDAVDSAQRRLAQIYARRVQLGFTSPEDVGFPKSAEEADQMEKYARATMEKIGGVLTTPDGQEFTSPYPGTETKEKMTPELRRQLASTYRAANQTLINAEVGRKNLGSTPAAAKSGASASGAPKQFTLKGKTYTEGQPVIGPDGKTYIVTGVNETTGKLMTRPR